MERKERRGEREEGGRREGGEGGREEGKGRVGVP